MVGVAEGAVRVLRFFAAPVAALVLLAGCSGGTEDAGGVASESSVDVPPARVSLAPADGATDVSPATPVEIAVTGGALSDVAVVDGAGTEVPGSVQPGTQGAAAVWTPEQPLTYGTDYIATVTAANAADEEVQATTAFTTVAPGTLFTPSIGPLDGTVVGVGMPIRVYFDQPVVEKADVERNLEVTSTEVTDGTWSWLDDTEVHFRPSDYWPANIDVTLDANLYGVHLGDGVWGEENRTITFSVGDRHVSIADVATHTMTVYDGDELVQTYPMSAGGPDFPSRNGAHVVTELNRDRVMDSSTYGVPVDSPDGYRTPVEYAVRLNDNGEFVHAAPWSVAQQGNANVSHGCINLSTERARWFFEFSRPGDVVEIENSEGPTLSVEDGDIYDWAIPWDEWQAGSALK